MGREPYQIKLDAELTDRLKEIVSRGEQHILKKRKHNVKDFLTWNSTRATIIRIYMTADYLNGLQLNKETDNYNAFDFLDFLNHAEVIIECVDKLAGLYSRNFTEEDAKTDIFNQKGADGKGTDKIYFKYLRSLCSAHPVRTDHYLKTYQDNENEYCPFVIWNNSGFNGTCDLYASVYIDKKDSYPKGKEIRISEIFEYVGFRYSLLWKVIDDIENEHNRIVDEYIKKPMKNGNDFGNYIEYLTYLKAEAEERLGKGRDITDDLGFAEAVFKLEPTNPENEEHYEKYKNALALAVEYIHEDLQNMRYDRPSLLQTIYYAHNDGKERCDDYTVEIISALEYDRDKDSLNPWGAEEWRGRRLSAYAMLESSRPFFEKYVTFEGAGTDFERYVLIKIALYFDCKENKCALNRNIPNELKYRDRVLTAEEWDDLSREEPVNDGEKRYSIQELLDLGYGV